MRIAQVWRRELHDFAAFWSMNRQNDIPPACLLPVTWRQVRLRVFSMRAKGEAECPE
jgi:hypothetical protein